MSLACEIAGNPIPGWDARLHLGLERRGGRTVLARVEHEGPLRVQRAFYPEGMAMPHVYMLHPPGGMVPGDSLDVRVEVAEGASALLTTPASGKVYGVGRRALPQSMRVSLNVRAGGLLEWMPLDTLLFDGAHFDALTTINLASDARLVFQEMSTLGRKAGGKPFISGQVTQRLRILREGVPLYIERMGIAAGSEFMTASWGLAEQSVYGVQLLTGNVNDDVMDCCRAFGNELINGARFSVTRVNGFVMGRYLGASAREGLAIFEKLWSFLRPSLFGKDACVPRVWST